MFSLKPEFTFFLIILSSFLFSFNQTAQAAEEPDTVSPPNLSLTVSGTNASASWSSVSGATGYILNFAPYPYEGPETIQRIDLADQTSFSAELKQGAAFYVAIQAYNGDQESEYSNIELLAIGQPSKKHFVSVSGRQPEPYRYAGG